MKKILTVIAFIILGFICISGTGSYETEKWVASEIGFTSDRDYGNPFYDVDLDVIFTHIKTGYELKIPGFWDSGRTFKVRFALNKTGEWSYVTVCSDKDNKDQLLKVKV